MTRTVGKAIHNCRLDRVISRRYCYLSCDDSRGSIELRWTCDAIAAFGQPSLWRPSRRRWTPGNRHWRPLVICMCRSGNRCSRTSELCYCDWRSTTVSLMPLSRPANIFLLLVALFCSVSISSGGFETRFLPETTGSQFH